MKTNRLLAATLSLVLITGLVSPAFGGTEPVPFDGEPNTVWVECEVIAGGSGSCSFTIGPSEFDIASFSPTWNCFVTAKSVCVVSVPNFVEPLPLKLIHITTDFAEVDSIECISDQLNVPGSRDSQVPNGDGFIEEWRCEPNPVLEDIFFSPTIKGFNNIVIHTVSKDIPPPPPPPVVGGELLSIETTSLILAGAQTFSWMIPVVLSVVGITLFVVSRKSE